MYVQFPVVMAAVVKKTQQSAAQCSDLKTDLHAQCFGYV